MGRRYTTTLARNRAGLFIFSALAASLFFAACPAHKTDLTTITWAVGKHSTGTQAGLARAFMDRHPGYAVRIIEMPESATSQRDNYVTYLSARDPSIDVYTIDITWPAEFASSQWILPLDGFFPRAAQGEFLPGPLKGCSYQGSVYAVPWFTDAGVLYYRKDLLEREGLSPPETWDELVSRAAQLQEKYALNGFVFQAEQYEGLVCNFLEYLWSFGGEVVDPVSKKVTLDSPAAEEALALWHGMLYRARIAPKGVLTYKEEESRQIFTSGQAVFLRNWPYVWTAAQNSAASKVAGNVGIAPLPGKRPGSGVSCLGGWNLAISRFSRHPEAAWQFIDFMAGAEAQKSYAIKGGRLPTRKAVYEDREVLEANPHYRTLYPVFVNARPRPTTEAYAEVSDTLQIELHKALTNQQSVQQALRNAQKKISALLTR